MKRIADALELLTAQHDEITTILNALRGLDGYELAHALGDLADRVATHLSVEEEFLGMFEAPAASEAEDLRQMLAEILVMDLSARDMPARIEAFAAHWRRHSLTQEHAVFIPLAESVTPAVLERIGTQLGEWSAQSRCLAA
jgi:hypothetical protein